MPRLICTYREFIAILTRFNFEIKGQNGGSHVRYRGEVGGEVKYVDVAAHNWGDNIPTGTLKSMIRQSGLSERLFRK